MSHQVEAPLTASFDEPYEEFIARWDQQTDGYMYHGPAAEPEGVSFHREVDEDLDPITYEVLRHALWNSVGEHAATCARGSGSPIVVFGHDLCPSLLTEDAEYVYVAAYVTFLGNTSQPAARWTLENRAEDPGIREGDMYLTNDPWLCGIHQQDMVLLCPVFVDGRLFCWVTNTMHQYDVGGNTPGSFCVGARDVYDEGMIIPPIKIVEQGELRTDLESFYLRHSRMPHLLALDLRAEISGCSVHRDRILTLVERYGAATVKAAMRRIIDDAEASFLERVSRLPEGTFSERGYLESGEIGSRATHRIQVNVTKRGDKLVIDNRGTDPEVGCLSSTLAGWRGGILNAIMATFLYDLQYAIGGPMRHVELRPEPGTLATARYPSSVSNAPQFTILRTIGLGVQAISRMLISDPAQRESIITTPSDCGSAAVTPISGINQRGEPFGNVLLEIQSAGRGAFSFRDGIPTGGLIYAVQGAMPNVEQSEHHMPILYLYMRETPDSGGAGRFARGNSLEVAVKLHDADEITVASVAGDVAVPGTPGLYGGHSGVTNRVAWHREVAVDEELAAGRIPHTLAQIDGTVEAVPPISAGESWTQDARTVLRYRVSGSAGYGDPLDRDLDLLEEDIELDYVSREAAELHYGAVFTGEEINREATHSNRQEQRRQRLEEFKPPERTLERAPELVTPSGEGMRLAEVVEARLGPDGAPFACCIACDQLIGPADEPMKPWLMQETLPAYAISPAQQDPEELVDGPFEFRRWCCPGCGHLIDAEIARADDAPLVSAQFESYEPPR